MKTIQLETLTRNILKTKNINVDENEEIFGEAFKIDIDEFSDLIPEDTIIEINDCKELMIASGEVITEDDTTYEAYIIYRYDTVPYFIILIDEDEERQTYSVLEGKWC